MLPSLSQEQEEFHQQQDDMHLPFHNPRETLTNAKIIIGRPLAPCLTTAAPRLQVSGLTKWQSLASTICVPTEVRYTTPSCFGEVTYFCLVGSRDTGVRRYCPKYDMIQLSKHGLFNSASHPSLHPDVCHHIISDDLAFYRV